MKMKAFLMFVLLFLCSMGTKAQELGANYNENIDYPITEIEMLKQSKVTWVRGFVNIPNLFLQNENGKIVGVKENTYSYTEIYSGQESLGRPCEIYIEPENTF